MRIRTTIIVAVCMAVGVWALAERGEKAPQPETVVLKLGTVAPDHTAWAEYLETFKRQVQKDTGGALAFEIGYGGRYGGEQRLVEQCRQGKLAMVGVSTTIVANILPELNVLEMPYLFNSTEEVDFIIDEIIDRAIAPRLEEKGLIVATWTDNGFKNLAVSKKPVRHPSDLKEMTIRSQQSRVYQAIFRHMGMKTVQLSVREVAQALQAGVVDTFDNSPMFTYTSGLYHYIHFYTLTEHTFQPILLLLSKKVYDRLPEHHRRSLLVNRLDNSRRSREIIRRAQKESLRKLEEAGITIIRLNIGQKAAFVQATRPVYQESKTLLGEDGQRLLDEVLSALKKHRRLRE